MAKDWSFIFSISPSCTVTKKWKYIFLNLPSYSPHPVFKVRVELLMQENSNSEMWSSLMLKKKGIIETFGRIFAQLSVGQPTILHWTCFLGRSTKVNMQKASVYTKDSNLFCKCDSEKLGMKERREEQIMKKKRGLRMDSFPMTIGTDYPNLRV